MLVLNGLTLTNTGGETTATAPIVCGKSTGVHIVVAAGTTNTLTDSVYNNDDNYPDNGNAENAVIKCKDGSQVTITGSGPLNIVSNGKNGIKSGTTDSEADASNPRDAFLTIAGPTMNIPTTVDDAISAEQELNILSGTFVISAADDGICSDLRLNIGAGSTAGPTIDIKQSVEGIEAATLNFYSGDISVLSTDDCVNVANSDLSNYPFSLSIYGGQGFGRPWGTPPAMPFGGQPDWQQFTPPTGRPGGWQGVQPPGDQGGQPADSPMGGQMGGWGSWQSAILSEGSVVTVQDSSGNILYSGTALCNAGYVVFSSPSLISGSSCSLAADGDVAATATAVSSAARSVTR